jgi:choline dehydrogenase-like flavoprotein
VLAARKYPSIVVAPRSGGFTLDVHAEQLPNFESRISLSEDHDGFGVPKLQIDWRYRPDDVRSIVTAMGLMGEAFAAGGHGTLTFEQAAVEQDLRREGAYGGHHLGTARMSESPRKGVVDSDGKVHGINNLYITGGAVFPTSGQANPTLTILALALRLGDHLKAKFAATSRRPDQVAAMPA